MTKRSMGLLTLLLAVLVASVAFAAETRDLLLAARSGDLAVVKRLVKYGLPFDSADDCGTTPLFLEKLGLRELGELPPLADHVPPAEVLDALERPFRPEESSTESKS